MNGSARSGSDIALCIDGDSLPVGDLDALDAQIYDLLLPWRIDLTFRQQIDNPDFLAHIKRVGVRLYPCETTEDHRQEGTATRCKKEH